MVLGFHFTDPLKYWRPEWVYFVQRRRRSWFFLMLWSCAYCLVQAGYDWEEVTRFDPEGEACSSHLLWCWSCCSSWHGIWWLSVDSFLMCSSIPTQNEGLARCSEFFFRCWIFAILQKIFWKNKNKNLSPVNFFLEKKSPKYEFLKF